MAIVVVSLLLALVGGLATWWLARGGGPYRLGPWPGLSPRGAALLLACAVLLAAGQLVLSRPTRPLPDLVQLAIVTLAPLALATRIVVAPGVASAVCGAYLLPRALVSLANSGVELPPPLIVPAMLFDLALWLRRGDIRLPRWRQGWRRKTRIIRTITPWRAAIGGAVFGLVIVASTSAFAAFVGGDAAAWSSNDVVLAAIASGVACAVLAACLFV